MSHHLPAHLPTSSAQPQTPWVTYGAQRGQARPSPPGTPSPCSGPVPKGPWRNPSLKITTCSPRAKPPASPVTLARPLRPHTCRDCAAGLPAWRGGGCGGVWVGVCAGDPVPPDHPPLPSPDLQESPAKATIRPSGPGRPCHSAAQHGAAVPRPHGRHLLHGLLPPPVQEQLVPAWQGEDGGGHGATPPSPALWNRGTALGQNGGSAGAVSWKGLAEPLQTRGTLLQRSALGLAPVGTRRGDPLVWVGTRRGLTGWRCPHRLGV